MTSRIGRALRCYCLAIGAIVLASGPHGAVLAHDAIHLISGYEHGHAHDGHARRHSRSPKHAHEIIVQPPQPFLVQAVPHADKVTTAVVMAVDILHTHEPALFPCDLRRTHDPPPRVLPSAFPPSFAAAPPAA